MSRFKELNQIETAIKSGDQSQLKWARQYCEARLKQARMKDHQKHWRKLLKRVERELDE